MGKRGHWSQLLNAKRDEDKMAADMSVPVGGFGTKVAFTSKVDEEGEGGA